MSITRFKQSGLHCPVCAGFDEMRRGQGARCSGFLSSDGRYAHCSRPELAGGLPAEIHAGEPTYAHALFGVCRCGVAHEAPDPGAVASAAPKRRGQAPLGEIVATYDYRGADGELVLQVLRYRTPDGAKTFRQRRPDGSGGWVWSVKDVALVPYRLPELLEGLMDGRPVYVVEGEKDADALHGLGEVATCNVAGAGKWTEAYTEFFRGSISPVHVVADKDLAGYRHALHVYRSLQAAGVTADLLESPDANDVSDHLEAGWFVADLVPLDPFVAQARAEDLEKAKRDTKAAEAAAPAEGKPHLRVVREGEERAEDDPEGCSDKGNTARFVRLHGDEVRFVKAWGDAWMVYDGRRWRRSDAGEIERRAEDVIREIYREASEASSRATREKLVRHALRTEQAKKIGDVLRFASWQEGIALRPDAFDRDPWLLNVANGTLDLRADDPAQALRAHDRKDLITRIAAAPFEIDAESQLWLDFLARTLPDADVRRYFQRAAGYSCTGSMREECAFFVYGGTASGKSTALEAIRETLGDYAQATTFDAFLRRREPGSTNSALARLEGYRFATASEVERGRDFAIATLKAVTSGDAISVRDLYKAASEFRPQCKIWFSANDRPRVPPDEDATWRRLHVVPFEQSLPETERDPLVKEALCAAGEHRTAILAWLILGAFEWRAVGGLLPPAAVRAALQAYRESQNPVAEFVDDCCERTDPIASEPMPVMVLLDAANRWAKALGRRPISAVSLGKCLSSLGFKGGKIAHTRVWYGLRIVGVPGTDGRIDA